MPPRVAQQIRGASGNAPHARAAARLPYRHPGCRTCTLMGLPSAVRFGSIRAWRDSRARKPLVAMARHCRSAPNVAPSLITPAGTFRCGSRADAHHMPAMQESRPATPWHRWAFIISRNRSRPRVLRLHRFSLAALQRSHTHVRADAIHRRIASHPSMEETGTSNPGRMGW